MKFFVQKDLNDPSILKIEKRTHSDLNTVCLAPEGENIDWLDIVDDAGSPFGKKAVINSSKKTTTLAKLASDKAKIDSDVTERENALARLKTKAATDKDIEDILKILGR
jgi:hypothetical protein